MRPRLTVVFFAVLHAENETEKTAFELVRRREYRAVQIFIPTYSLYKAAEALENLKSVAKELKNGITHVVENEGMILKRLEEICKDLGVSLYN